MARQLLEEGGTMVFMEVPPGTEFGIDLNSWNTGERFRGVKMIPPGVHFIYYSATNKEGDTAPRTGFFHVFSKQEMVAKKWDKRAEDISEEEISEADKERLHSRLTDLDPFLGVYPYESWRKWISLAGRITESVVASIAPPSRRILSAPELIPDNSEPESGLPIHRSQLSREEMEEAKLPRMKPRPGTQINFTPFPKRRFPEGSSSHDVTKYSLDSSYVLQVLLSHYEREEDLLGEIQMAFICFLVGQSYDAFEQWKKLVHTLCTCSEALEKYPALFTNFVADLYFQIQEVPEDCFVDIVTTNNFIYNALQCLFRNVQDCDNVDAGLKAKVEKFETHVTKKYKWDFSGEADDEAPVIVENAGV